MQKIIGAFSLAGGLAWVAACLVHNAQPQGCIGDACDLGGTERGSTAVDQTLMVVAGLLLAVSGLGLLLLPRRRGRSQVAGMVAALAGSLALVMLLSALVVASRDPDWEGMPGLVVPGVVLLAIALVSLGFQVLRAEVLPRVVAVVLIATALLLPFANEQTSRILLAIPFGLAWVAAGIALLRQSNSAAALSR